MATFHVRFHRYDNNRQSRISGTRHINADSFEAAFYKAETLRTGMSDADPDSRYTIIEIGTHDQYGVDCSGGGRLWETGEELSARIAAD